MRMSQRLVSGGPECPEAQQVYAISGSEPDPPEGEDKPEGEGDGDGEGPDSEGPRTYTEAEYDALKARMVAADREKTAAQKRLDAIDDADKSELAKAQEAAAEALARAETAETAAREARIGREFLKFPGYDWHDPETALALVDLSGVTIEDDGKVKGMKAAVERLAKDKPFLLKPKEDQGGATGHTPQGRPNLGQERRNELVGKYKL